MEELMKQLHLEHKRIDDLFFHTEQSEEPSHKLSFAETALNEIAVLCKIESTLIYPRLENELDPQSTTLKHWIESHDKLLEAVERFADRSTFDATYAEEFAKIPQLFNAHVDIEEHQLFPQIKHLSFDDLIDEIPRKRAELLQRSSAGQRDFTPQSILFGEQTTIQKSV